MKSNSKDGERETAYTPSQIQRMDNRDNIHIKSNSKDGIRETTYT